MAGRESQSEHNRIVKYVAEFLKKEGFDNVRADIDGFETPRKIIWSSTEEGYIPDVTAEKKGRKYLFEVKTEDSIYDKHTEDQWRLFATYAKEHSAIFCVVVPEKARNIAIKRLTELKIIAEIWGV